MRKRTQAAGLYLRLFFGHRFCSVAIKFIVSSMINPVLVYNFLRPTQILSKFFVVLLLMFSISSVSAQQEVPDQPYYIVQPGDSLWDISLTFGIPVSEIERVNGITDPNQLIAGTKLTVPGLLGYSGEIRSQETALGDSLYRISRRYGIPRESLVQINRITSPSSVYAGSSFLLPVVTEEERLEFLVSFAPGQSVFELAIQHNTNPWLLKIRNGLTSDWEVLPGDDLFLSSEQGATGGNTIPPVISVSVDPLILTQGKTVEIKISAPPGMRFSGTLGEKEFQFFPVEGGYTALQGIHALADPGLSSLTITGQYHKESPSTGQAFRFSQSLLLKAGDYPLDPVLMVDPETIDPTVTKPEDKLWKSLGEVITQEKLWEGSFVLPVPDVFKDCWTSLFGNRRSYNNGPYDFFHSGLDFCGQEGTELYAAAAGNVVFVDALKVRGNVIVIDHGWGVYTAYDHLSQQLVRVGDTVQPGQLLGLGGATGRTTGPHLHWEVWVGGVQVDPVDWLSSTYP